MAYYQNESMPGNVHNTDHDTQQQGLQTVCVLSAHRGIEAMEAL